MTSIEPVRSSMVAASIILPARVAMRRWALMMPPMVITRPLNSVSTSAILHVRIAASAGSSGISGWSLK